MTVNYIVLVTDCPPLYHHHVEDVALTVPQQRTRPRTPSSTWRRGDRAQPGVRAASFASSTPRRAVRVCHIQRTIRL